jgi:hypothetical protein
MMKRLPTAVPACATPHTVTSPGVVCVGEGPVRLRARPFVQAVR